MYRTDCIGRIVGRIVQDGVFRTDYTGRIEQDGFYRTDCTGRIV